MDFKRERTKMTISLSVEEKVRLQTMATSEGLTVSSLISEWINEKGPDADAAFDFMTQDNPFIEMFDLMKLTRRFEAAVEANLVMSLQEFCDRYVHEDENGKLVEDIGDAECMPFVYLGYEHVEEGITYPFDILSCESGKYVTTSDGDVDLEHGFILWRDMQMWGYPRLIVVEDGERMEGLPEGTAFMRLQYVNLRDPALFKTEDAEDMTWPVYLNRENGVHVWWKKR